MHTHIFLNIKEVKFDTMNFIFVVVVDLFNGVSLCIPVWPGIYDLPLPPFEH